MGWEAEKLERTLFIERYSQGGKTYYAVSPLCRVTTDVGKSYLEPLPFDMFLGSRDVFRFNTVEFIDPPIVDRADGKGDLGLTNVREEGVRRGA